jgi:cytochrome c oxidase subunit 4
MLDLAPLLLDVIDFFENPAYLLGIPLLFLGALGLAFVTSPVEVRWPEPRPYSEDDLLPPPEGHPTARGYIQIGMILAVITLIEVAFYYVDLADGVLLAVLMVASALKFVLVVLWFMHLRFDSRLFSILFWGCLTLAVSLFMVVLATLGSSLV